MTSIVFLDRDSLPTAVPPLPLPHRWQDYPATSPEQLLENL
jgi:glycerate dehydrogenase